MADETAKLTDNQRAVLRYLKGKGFVSPTKIGEVVGGYSCPVHGRPLKRHSAWASPICKSLVKKGLLQRSAIGWYATTDKEEDHD